MLLKRVLSHLRGPSASGVRRQSHHVDIPLEGRQVVSSAHAVLVIAPFQQSLGDP